MASLRCSRIVQNISLKAFHQIPRVTVQGTRISACFPAISHQPLVLGMAGSRSVSKAKPTRGMPKVKPVPGYRVGVTKGFESQHTGSLKGSFDASDRMLDDIMLRKYIEGVFYNELDSDIIVKRRDNRIIISFLVSRESDITKFYFLTSFSEKVLSEVFGCIVKFEPQASS